MFDFMNMNMNMTFFHGIGMIIFWSIVIFILFSLLDKNENKKEETALDILKKRLARGEITKEEYKSLKESIK